MMGLVRRGLLMLAGLPLEGMSAGEVVRERGGGWLCVCHALCTPYSVWVMERRKEKKTYFIPDV